MTSRIPRVPRGDGAILRPARVAVEGEDVLAILARIGVPKGDFDAHVIWKARSSQHIALENPGTQQTGLHRLPAKGLECLQFLPITTEYLRESKVGANVKRLARDTKSDKLKRACTAIIEKWYRMIFNLDNGYDPDGAYEEQYRAYLHEK